MLSRCPKTPCWIPGPSIHRAISSLRVVEKWEVACSLDAQKLRAGSQVPPFTCDLIPQALQL